MRDTHHTLNVGYNIKKTKFNNENIDIRSNWKNGKINSGRSSASRLRSKLFGQGAEKNKEKSQKPKNPERLA